MKTSHYKIGDSVRILKDMPMFGIKKGDLGTVTEPIGPSYFVPDGSVMVCFEQGENGNIGAIRFFNTIDVRECDLVPANATEKQDGKQEAPSVRHIVFDITNDGGEARYINGKKVVRKAKIRRSSEDEPNDFNAMMYLVGKLFPESEMRVSKLPGKEREDKLPPAVEGYLAVLDLDGDPAYVSIDQIENIVETEEDGRKIVLVYTVSESRYEIPGYRLCEVMDMVREARGW